MLLWTKVCNFLVLPLSRGHSDRSVFGSTCCWPWTRRGSSTQQEWTCSRLVLFCALTQLSFVEPIITLPENDCCNKRWISCCRLHGSGIAGAFPGMSCRRHAPPDQSGPAACGRPAMEPDHSAAAGNENICLRGVCGQQDRSHVRYFHLQPESA